MTYLQANNRSNKRQKRTILVSGIVVLIIAALIFWTPHFFPSIFNTIVRPFWRMEFSLQSGSLRSPTQLLNENENLKQQLADAQVRMQTIQATETENAEFKAMLGRASTTPRILAAVLKRPPFSGYDEIIIDAGLDKGFSTTSLVYASGNILIGKVSDVLGETSKVTLFSSPGQKYDVLIGAEHAPAVAVGRGGGQYEAQLSRDVKVVEGDVVVSPSLNDKAFGIVTGVLSDPAQPFETVLFAPPVNVYQLRWVLVNVKGK